MRVTGLTPGSAATYTVRHRVTIGDAVRTSAESRPLAVTTSTGTWPGNGKVNQQWRIAATAPGSTQYTLASQHSLKCVAIAGGAAVTGAFVVQQTCDGAQSQRWTFTVHSDVTYQMRPVGSANLCVQSNGIGAGARLALANCSATEPSQHWTANRIS